MCCKINRKVYWMTRMMYIFYARHITYNTHKAINNQFTARTTQATKHIRSCGSGVHMAVSFFDGPFRRGFKGNQEQTTLSDIFFWGGTLKRTLPPEPQPETPTLPKLRLKNLRRLCQVLCAPQKALAAASSRCAPVFGFVVCEVGGSPRSLAYPLPASVEGTQLKR